MVNNIYNLNFLPNKQKWQGKYKSRINLISMCDLSGLNQFEIEHSKYTFSEFDKYFKYQ